MKAALLPRAGIGRREAAWGKYDHRLCSLGGKAGKSTVSSPPVLPHIFMSGSSVPDPNSEGKMTLETQLPLGMDFSPRQERSCSCRSGVVGL